MASDFYVYIYFRPTGVPCYVGKGRRHRWLAHLQRETNPHLGNIIRANGGDLPRLKVREGLTEAEAVEAEIAFIAAIGREANGGPLVNLTDGDDGMSGHVQSAATRQKRAAALRGVPKTSVHIAAAAKANSLAKIGKKTGPCSETRRAAISAAKKGVPMAEGHRLAMIGKTYSPERRAAISAALTGKTRSPEAIAKFVATMKARKAA